MEFLFRWQPWPQDAVTPNLIDKKRSPNAMREFTGGIARVPIYPGEPISRKKLLKARVDAVESTSRLTVPGTQVTSW